MIFTYKIINLFMYHKQVQDLTKIDLINKHLSLNQIKNI